MPLRDLRAFCGLLESRRQLHRVPTPVSSDGELLEVAARVARRGGPALLFENVAGGTAVVVDAFGAPERAAWALGVDKLDDLRDRLGEVLGVARVGVAGGVGGTLRAIGELAQLGRLVPRRMDRGRAQEVTARAPTLDALPIPRRSADGPRRLPFALVVAPGRSAQTREVLALDGTTLDLGVRLAPGPVAIVLGADPTAIYAGLAPLPEAVDPLVFAGFLRRAPLEVARARTVDLEVPAAAEHVLEGRVGADGLFHLEHLTHRKGAMLLASTAGTPPRDERWLGAASERLFLPFLRLAQPEIVDLVAPTAGGFAEVVLVSIRKEHPGQAQKVLAGLFGSAPTMRARAIVVFDADVDLRDAAACARRAVAEVDWRRDVLVLEGPVEGGGAAPKVGIDATRDPSAAAPVESDGVPAEVRALVDRKWAAYGVPF